MIVADGSALVIAATDSTNRGHSVRRRLDDEAPVAAPHLVDAEIGQGIRSLLLRRLLAASEADASRGHALALVAVRYAHRHLGERAWELRDNVSFYDGLYVALAERLGATLLTANRKLSGATELRCRVDVV